MNCKGWMSIYLYVLLSKESVFLRENCVNETAFQSYNEWVFALNDENENLFDDYVGRCTSFKNVFAKKKSSRNSTLLNYFNTFKHPRAFVEYSLKIKAW